ncbi:MAG: Gfo/Idh/MocA family oxidoreductase [Verrucomicrobia bacterium]|nr:Gfo/Idh/MocA family oxidoreductase [Verrucomicrobiota bacterium]
MNERIVRVGVVGVGSLGQYHARVYSELPNAEFVGIYDVDPARAKEIADKYGAEAFGSIDELTEKTEALSVVVPTDLHREIGGVLLEKGQHLLIEKPIAATTAEATELVALAERNGVILQVGHIERFNPVMAYLEKAAENPRFIEAHRLAPYPPPRDGLHPRGTEVSVVLDLMIHDLELILHLVRSPIIAVNAVGVPVLSPTEDIANVRLSFENGCVANVTASRISPERMRKIRVFLGDAYISLDYQEQSGEAYKMTTSGIAKEDVPIEKGDALEKELGAFVECVARRDNPVVSGEHAAEALKLAVSIIEKIQDSPS